MNRIAQLVTLLALFLSVTANAANWQGALAPELMIKNQHNKVVSIKDYQGSWLVLYFYPKDETPGCTLEANNFRKDYQKYLELNTKIVGISVDDVESHQGFITNHKLPFDLLADVEGKVSKSYKVLLNLGLTKLAKRQTFIVDPDGTIVKHYNDVTPKSHSNQLLEDLPKLITLWKSTKG